MLNLMKLIIYCNLTIGVVLLGTSIKGPFSLDYYFIIGLFLTIWYNWETLKQLSGQRNGLNKLNFVIGILTLLFGGLMTLAGLGMIEGELEGLGGRGHVVLGAIDILFGVTTILASLKTLKIYRTA